MVNPVKPNSQESRLTQKGETRVTTGGESELKVTGTSISTRLVVLTTGLVALLILATFYSLSLQIRDETRSLLQGLLNRSERQVETIKEENLRQLIWASSQISSSPSLRAAMETYRLEYSPGIDVEPVLLATISNELDKVWAGLDHDILIVTDDRGLVLSANNRAGDWPMAGEDLSTLPVLTHVLNPLSEPGDNNFGVITQQGVHFLVSGVPIAIQGYIVGSLVLGDRIDADFLPNIRAFFGGEILVSAGSQTIVSTLPSTAGQSSGALALAENGTTALDSDGTIDLGGEQFLVTALGLGQDQSGKPVHLFLLRSLTQAMAGADRTLVKTLASQAMVAITLAALLSWLVTRASLKPLNRFVSFMRRVGESGDYSMRFKADSKMHVNRQDGSESDGSARLNFERRGNEVIMLGDALNRMLAVIEERDSSIKSAHGRLVSTVAELQQKDSELRHLQKMEALGLLAGGVAHDFNNILQVVTGFSDLALRSLSEDDPARELINEVLKASQSAAMMTRQLLSLSSKQVFNPKVININHVVLDLQKILRTVVGESIRVTTDLAPDLNNVLVDPAQVEQILLNLTVNARDAIEGNGAIHISTANGSSEIGNIHISHTGYDSGCVIISVRDDGCGMDEETRSQIFDPFFTTKELGKGTGLGLSTVHGIVRKCGGMVQVESAPGEGSEFRVVLPAVEAELEDKADEGNDKLEEWTGTILLVEDEDNVRKLVSKMLSLSGYRVLEADGPDQALEQLQTHTQHVDLLVTDVIMPRMNGRELQKQVVKLRPDIQTLFISGYAAGVIDDVGVLDEGLNFLQKPFTPDALAQKVKQILQSGT